MKKPVLIFDIECYRNYFLVYFLNAETDNSIFFEVFGENESLPANLLVRLTRILESATLVSFNGNNYDMLILSDAMNGATCSQMKILNDDIIQNGLKPWNYSKKYGTRLAQPDHIDIMEVLPGQGGLKVYGGRMHEPRLQELPVKADENIQVEQVSLLRHYCLNDLITTKNLYLSLKDALALRVEMSAAYGVDLRSKSDAQIAEAVIVKEVEKRTGCKINKPNLRISGFVYDPPEFLKFQNPDLQAALLLVRSVPFSLKKNGAVEMPEELEKLTISIGGSVYQMGAGGLHSTEKETAYRATETHLLADFDVTSYYPSIILNNRLYPENIGETFLEVYQELVDKRLAAKAAGDKKTADSLKIVINGSYGKLGSPYSSLFAPKLLIQVTLTGQLSLLMLIEWLEKFGIAVISGNTDGIVTHCPVEKEATMLQIIKLWEQQTGFTMERTNYSGIFSRDVNNYIAVKTDGKVKTKGCFASAGYMKNPTNEVCTEAVVNLLVRGTPVEETIKGCTDITRFTSLRKVKGGAVDEHGTRLGGTLRWYYAFGCVEPFRYASNGNKVPRTDGAKLLLDLPQEFPTDINYDWYINEANDLLMDIGMKERPPCLKPSKKKSKS